MKAQQLKYLLALPALMSYAANIMIEGLTAQNWWGDLPWGAINYATIIAVASFIISDLVSPQSWIRRWWFEVRAPFSLISVILNDEFDPDRVVIRALVRFKKIPTSAAATFLVTPTSGRSAGQNVCGFEVGLGGVHLDTNEKLDIGVIMVPSPGWTPRRSVWGAGVGPEQLSNAHPDIIFGAPVRVTMKVDGFERSFALLPTGKTAHPEAATVAIFTENDAEHVVRMK